MHPPGCSCLSQKLGLPKRKATISRSNLTHVKIEQHSDIEEAEYEMLQMP